MFSGRQAQGRLPEGVTVATYRSYETAQQAINSLAEAEIDVSGIALVGNDVRVVERVMGRLTWRKVAMAGAMRGLTFGLFLGIVFWLLVPEAGMMVLAMPILGVAFGMLLSIVTHSFTKKNRQYQSVQQIIPASFDLVAPQEVAAAVMHKLGPGVRRAAAEEATASESASAEEEPASNEDGPADGTTPARDERIGSSERVPNPLADSSRSQD